MARRMLIAGNWKMNGLRQSLVLIEEIRGVANSRSDLDILIAPPATLIESAAKIAGPVKIAGQDCHTEQSGAHTGDISAEMLRDAGASHVILGHSERRADHNEPSAMVRAKALAALSAGLIPVICVGESEAERRAGTAEEVVGQQLEDSLPDRRGYIIAYEPVWAIGTGLTASLDDIAAMHGFIRSKVPGGSKVQILYGGSVKPENASGILSISEVDGALVGGASLEADSFSAIIEAAPIRFASSK